jgi:cysteine desulfurase/selenocysteine lyase
VLTQVLHDIPGVRVVGTADRKVAVASFLVDGMPTERVGAALDLHGIAVRAGHHCAQPALRRFGLESTVRASLAFYNTEAEIHSLGAVLQRLTSGSRSSHLGG